MKQLSRRTLLGASVALGASPVALTATASTPAVAHLAPEGVVPVFLSTQLPIVLVRTRGRGPLPMLFDTGSDGASLDTRVARDLRLRRVRGEETTVVDGATGASFTAHNALLPDMSMGGYVLGDQSFTIHDFQRDNAVGLFGAEMFSGRAVYMDLAHARLRIRARNEMPVGATAKYDYVGEPGAKQPGLEIILPGYGALRALMDTGSNGALILPIEFIDRVPLRAPPTVIGRQISVSGSRDVLGGRINGDVQIGSVTLTNPDVTFGSGLPNVGLPVLRRLRILLDPIGACSWLLNRQTPPASTLAEFQGQYAEGRSIRLEGDALIYQLAERPPQELHPLGADLFERGDTSDLLDFRRQNGSITGFTIVSGEYRVTDVAKTA